MTGQCINGDGQPVAIKGTRECRRCYNARWRRENPDYHRDRRARLGDVERERAAAYREEHREELRARRQARYLEEHADEIAARAARRAAGCPNDGRPIEARGVCSGCYAKLRYLERHDAIRQYQRAWYAANRDEINRRQRERRAARRSADGA